MDNVKEWAGQTWLNLAFFNEVEIATGIQPFHPMIVDFEDKEDDFAVITFKSQIRFEEWLNNLQAIRPDLDLHRIKPSEIAGAVT